MTRGAILSLTLLASACGAEPPRSVRYDLEQIAAETLTRDTSPGFSALPDTNATAPAG